jgi:hypothetical protein
MRKFFLSVLLLSSAALAQTCQTNTGPLFSRTPQVTGTGVCDQGPETAGSGNVVTYTDVYHDTTIGTSDSVAPNKVFLDVNSSPVSGTGACYYKPPVINPKTGFVINPAVIIDCPPISVNKITAATDVNDFNRFIAQIRFRVIPVDGLGNPTGCVETGVFNQTLNQVPGVACAPITSGGSLTDPCLGGSAPDPGTGAGFTDGGTGPAPTCSPIIIDTEGEGFHLTAAANGVMFDIRGDGHPVQIAWTASGFHNAFLALPGADGLVHNGKQLFGNFTQQPKSDAPNGFLALAEFDKPENGGNGDRIIDEHDAVYSRLRLWIDANHDGISQPEELHTLAELGVYALSLDYRHSRRTDDFGNEFRFKAKVNSGIRRDFRDEASEVGRWTYDVFLVTK